MDVISAVVVVAGLKVASVCEIIFEKNTLVSSIILNDVLASQ